MLKVLVAGSVLAGMREAAAAFSLETGIPASVTTDHGHNIEALVRSGRANADVIAIPAPMMGGLAAAGHVDATSVIAIGTVRIGGAVHRSTPAPDISSMGKLQDAVNEARQILLTNAPTGEHLTAIFSAFGAPSPIEPKIRRFDTATLLHEYLAAHPQAGALGFAPVTEILNFRSRDVEFAGPIPDDIQIALPYQACMPVRTASDAAAGLLTFLGTPTARRCFAASGVERAV